MAAAAAAVSRSNLMMRMMMKSFANNNNPLSFARTFTSLSTSSFISETLFPSASPNKFDTLSTHFRLFSSRSNNTNSPYSFSFSDSDDDNDEAKNKKQETPIDKSKLPPPYDPFNKKPVIEEPKDPKNLQEVFHNMKTDGLMNNAIKMFDALSKDGLTHEALELFAVIKDKGDMPEVVAHTAVIEAYANAGGHSKDAIKVYMRMLASGVKPNAYTYTVLIRGLAKDGKLGDAKKYILEMMGRGMRPNVGTYTAVFEAFAREEKMEEGRELLEQMKGKGFVVAANDENAVREHLSSKRGEVFRNVMNLLFGKNDEN